MNVSSVFNTEATSNFKSQTPERKSSDVDFSDQLKSVSADKTAASSTKEVTQEQADGTQTTPAKMKTDEKAVAKDLREYDLDTLEQNITAAQLACIAMQSGEQIEQVAVENAQLAVTDLQSGQCMQISTAEKLPTLLLEDCAAEKFQGQIPEGLDAQQVRFVEQALKELASSEQMSQDDSQSETKAQTGFVSTIEKMEKITKNDTPFLDTQSALAPVVISLPVDKAAQLELPQVKQILVNQIVEQVKTAVDTQKSRLHIQLKPDVLGGMVIELSMGSDGLRAQLLTQNKQTAMAVSDQLTQLADTLRDKGIQVVSMEVVDQSLLNNDFAEPSPNRGQQNRGQSLRTFSREDAATQSVGAVYAEMILDAGAATYGVEYSA